MKIVWQQSAYIGSAPVFCTICDRRSFPIRGSQNQILLAVLCDEHDVVWGEVCQACIATGTEGIQATLNERIERLRCKMADLEMLAQKPIELPTLESEFSLHRVQSP